MNTKLLATLLAIGISGAALAADLPEFSTVDIDNDGKITMEEAEQLIELGFDFNKADTNEDDVIDQDEYDRAVD